MTEVRGAKIEYTPTSIEAFRGKLEIELQFPPVLVQHLVAVAQNYRDGIFAGTNDVVETITRTPARTVQACIAQHRKAWPDA